MRVILADDHELIREGLKPFLLELERNTEIIEADSLEDVLRHSGDDEKIDIIILDLVMPGMNEFEGIKTTVKKFPDTPIVVISGFYTQQNVMTAMECGAAGFVPKTMGGTTILNALRLVLSGESYVPPAIMSMFDDDVAGKSPYSSNNPLSLLNDRESEILGLMISGNTNNEIADKIGLKEITIKVHLSSVYKKLSAKNRATATRIALDNGWTPSHPDSHD